MAGGGGVDAPRPPLGPLLRSRLDLMVLVAVGGAAGALARWGVEESLPQADGAFAWWLLLVNTSGAALLGLLVMGLATRRPTSRRARPLLGTGVLGGWTTFSAASLDLQQHLAGGRPGAAAVSFAVGLVLPVLAAWVGTALAQATAPRPGPAPGPAPGGAA